MAIERLLTGSIRERVQDLMSTEDLIIDSNAIISVED